MHRPVLVSSAESHPVNLDDVKAHLRVDHSDDDPLLEGLIEAATSYLDGWTGVLGRCLAEQVWMQEFDSFARELSLPLGPVICIQSVTWRNQSGQVTTIAKANYDLRTDAAGRSVLRFDDGYAFPGPLHESRAISVTYRVGYEKVPTPLKVAIMMLVGHWYENREAAGASMSELPIGVSALIAPYRRVGA